MKTTRTQSLIAGALIGALMKLNSALGYAIRALAQVTKMLHRMYQHNALKVCHCRNRINWSAVNTITSKGMHGQPR
jgi:hypothetical protein